MLKTGDIGVCLKNNIVSDFTNGVANHVWMVCGDEIYETESKFFGGSGKSGFSPLNKYDKEPYIVFRPNFLTDETRVKLSKICFQRQGTPYSYWDCCVDFVLFFLPMFPEWKGRLAQALGTKLFTKCDEEVISCIYGASGYRPFFNTGSFTPQTLMDFMIRKEDFDIIERHLV